MSYVPDVTGHRMRWIESKFPAAPKRLKRIMEAVIGDSAMTWFPSAGQGDRVTFTRTIEVDGAWPHDTEIVEVTFDFCGRFKSCHRSKVIRVEEGRSYYDLHRMLRFPKQGDAK